MRWSALEVAEAEAFEILEPNILTSLQLELTELRRIIAESSSGKRIRHEQVAIQYDKLADSMLAQIDDDAEAEEQRKREELAKRNITVASNMLRRTYSRKG